MVSLTALILALGVLYDTAIAGKNITVDDTNSTLVTFNPGSKASPGWNQEPGCTVCSLKPDASMAHNGTWHDDLWISINGGEIWADLSFLGVAVYVFNIIPNDEINALTNLSFVMDGDNGTLQTYQHVPDNSSSFLYNVSVFSMTGLTNQSHTLRMFVEGQTQDLAVLFDYYVYTTADEAEPLSNSTTPNTSPKRSNNVKVIAPAVVCSIAGVALIAAIAFYFLRQRTVRVSQYPLAASKKESVLDIAELPHSDLEAGGFAVQQVHGQAPLTGGGNASFGAAAAVHDRGPSSDYTSVNLPSATAYSHSPWMSQEKVRSATDLRPQRMGSTTSAPSVVTLPNTITSPPPASTASTSTPQALSPTEPGVSRDEVGALWAEVQRLREQQAAHQEQLVSLEPLPQYEEFRDHEQ